MRPRVKKLILFSPLFLVAIALFVALGGEVVRLLWNWLLPPLFGWHELTFWQALGLLALCRILFGGLGGHDHARTHFRRHVDACGERLTPEERDRLRQRLHDRFGLDPSGGAGESR
jgi:hypothetical protein